MEHVVQFGISIDDEIIRTQILESAEKQIVSDIKQILLDAMFEHNYYTHHADSTCRLNTFCKKLVLEVMEENKDVIIQKAAEMLADSLKRTKKVKQVVDSVIEDGSSS